MKIFISILFITIFLFLLIFASLFDVEVNEKDIHRINHFKDAVIDDNPRNLLHFLQISDLHLSKFKESSRISDFRVFCSEVVGIVKPKVVSYS